MTRRFFLCAPWGVVLAAVALCVASVRVTDWVNAVLFGGCGLSGVVREPSVSVGKYSGREGSRSRALGAFGDSLIESGVDRGDDRAGPEAGIVADLKIAHSPALWRAGMLDTAN